ncbi:MAG: 2OG-Fe(II) oxygenase [Alphaproteobacteria bacterium]
MEASNTPVMALPRAPQLLGPGDPVPWFTARTAMNPNFAFDTMAGRHIVLTLIGSTAHPLGRAVVDGLLAQRVLFDDDNIALFLVTSDVADEAEGRIADMVPGIRWFRDSDIALARRLGALYEGEGGGPRVAVHSLVLDPSLRVIARIVASTAEEHVEALLAELGRLPRIADPGWAPGPAPVLVVPNILDRSLCRRLIDLYEGQGGSESGFMTSRDGKSVGIYDPRRKRRKDCVIEDEALRAELRANITRRLLPQIERGLQFAATRIERYIVACYEGERAGFFAAHRDNTTPATRHRKFAVTINLNAEEYDGGDLRFPEFGPATYRAPTGGAVVFSCSLLHEALPVTRGLRFAFLPFLYDQVAAEVRRQTTGLIVDAAAPPPAADSPG